MKRVGGDRQRVLPAFGMLCTDTGMAGPMRSPLDIACRSSILRSRPVSEVRHVSPLLLVGSAAAPTS